jgi:HD-like signal output (HDOD) protein
MGALNIPDQIVREIESLPMLSEVASKLLQLAADDDHDLRQVAHIIESDVYLSANVLKLANSAAFSRGHQIETVNRAVLQIGEGLVLSLAIEMSTGDMLRSPISGYAQEEGSLWAFCLQEAIAAREIARHAKSELRPDLAYTAGMMFNIGMVVMSSHLEKGSDLILAKLDDPDHGDFLQTEREVVGTDRDAVGANIADRWHLPESIITAIRYGHRPNEAPKQYAPLVYAVHMGDIMARTIGFGSGIDALSYTLDEGYEEHFNLERDALEGVFLDILDEFTKIKNFFLGDK